MPKKLFSQDDTSFIGIEDFDTDEIIAELFRRKNISTNLNNEMKLEAFLNKIDKPLPITVWENYK